MLRHKKAYWKQRLLNIKTIAAEIKVRFSGIKPPTELFMQRLLLHGMYAHVQAVNTH